ncbi:high-potential iron-sulfur protein [Haloferax sp. S1W]|uniref:high-potential iron-sulfur protein n=1 Tax=Haloferax sp. S1W TaxID=3377110 RepID=UPI0037C82960
MSFSDETRRRFLQLAGGGTVVSLAGCLGGDGGQEETTTTTTTTTEAEEDGQEHEEELPEGVSEEEFVHGPVPEAYRTALSQAGEKRNPDELFTKEATQFQEATEAVEAGLAQEGQDCGNCAEYIPDKNGDGFGACARVEGYIDPEDWCSLWESIEEAEAEQEEEGEDGGGGGGVDYTL